MLAMRTPTLTRSRMFQHEKYRCLGAQIPVGLISRVCCNLILVGVAFSSAFREDSAFVLYRICSVLCCSFLNPVVSRI
ncbi:uncharacterized protein CC84DRAFT_429534 [Paraphaeosphaeria sporulosa]|uniref:Amino acid permease/ SLC12A domain-containing protein n=1 Tax=Paraphaeosphaeria sporulosa TaxID=1460663 RepID=A0A177BWG8_9PLEO|nr:uncharacterized protein CC84DRAFT_429534 [Paraphaeosphaeria sporulosa]OAF98669.1 hypothetical protein CC84DRAFT_429534 [Paraphaeosphaeria sporulosa]